MLQKVEKKMETQKIEILEKDLFEKLIHSNDVMVSSVKKLSRYFWVMLIFFAVIGSCGSAWFYFAYRHPHIRYIKSVEGKTYIGLTDAANIEANPDREHGGSLIEVVHREKK